MATLTTKKQARYVRGPDGVYKRETPTTSSNNAANPAAPDPLVEKLIDELVECGYQVEDPLRTLPNAATSQQTEPAGITTPSIANIANVANIATSNPNSNSNSNPMSDSDLAARQKIVDLIVPAPTTLASLLQAYRNWLARFPVEKFMEWSLPFFLGMATMYTLLAAQPMLLYYGGVVALGLKLLFIYGTFFVGICWKAGWIKIDSWRLWGESSYGLFALGILPSAPVSPLAGTATLAQNTEAPAHIATSGVTAKAPEDIDEDLPSPNTERLREVRPFIPPLREEPELPRPRILRVSTDIKDTKSRFRTRMSPVRLARDNRRHSSASLGSHSDHRDPYRDVRDQYTKVREFRDLKGAVRDFGGERGREPKERFYKPLPPVISMNQEVDYETDLPLVHEVKLKSLETDDPFALDRLNTKKSVLGTRANYLKFLSNVES